MSSVPCHDGSLRRRRSVGRRHHDLSGDPFAVEFGRQFGSSPKASERQIAAMTAAMLSGSAA